MSAGAFLAIDNSIGFPDWILGNRRTGSECRESVHRQNSPVRFDANSREFGGGPQSYPLTCLLSDVIWRMVAAAISATKISCLARSDARTKPIDFPSGENRGST